MVGVSFASPRLTSPSCRPALASGSACLAHFLCCPPVAAPLLCDRRNKQHATRNRVSREAAAAAAAATRDAPTLHLTATLNSSSLPSLPLCLRPGLGHLVSQAQQELVCSSTVAALPCLPCPARLEALSAFPILTYLSSTPSNDPILALPSLRPPYRLNNCIEYPHGRPSHPPNLYDEPDPAHTCRAPSANVPS